MVKRNSSVSDWNVKKDENKTRIYHMKYEENGANSRTVVPIVGADVLIGLATTQYYSIFYVTLNFVFVILIKTTF